MFWPSSDELDSPLAWGRVLSFAACIQDASAVRVERPEQLSDLLEDMLAALDPSLQIYRAAVDHGPGPVKIRATYQLAGAIVALMTRARSSIPAPAAGNSRSLARYHAFHAELERLLHEPALLAWKLYVLIDRAVAAEPSLAPDEVTQNMVRSARELAEQLRRGAGTPFDPADAPFATASADR